MRPSSLPRRIASALAVGMLFVVLGSAIVHWLVGRTGVAALGRLDRFTDYDRTGTLPAIYCSLLLLACSVALGWIAHTKWTRGGVFVGHWSMLALAFAAGGIDKLLGIHHRFVPLAHTIQGLLHISNLLLYLTLGVVLLVAYALYGRFLRCLASTYRRQFLFAAVIFLAGAVIYDKIDHLFVRGLASGALLTQFVLAFEDLLEIGGVLLFFYALLQYVVELQLALTLPRRGTRTTHQDLPTIAPLREL